MSSTEISVAVIAIIRNKYLAMNIGPEGFGIYGLLNSFFTLLSLFAGIWLTQGVVKYVAEYHNSKNYQKSDYIFYISLTIGISLSIVILLIAILLNNIIRSTFLSKEILRSYYILFVGSFLFSNINQILSSYLQGLKKIRSVVRIKIFYSLLEIIIVITFVKMLGLIGFFASFIISGMINTILLWKIIKSTISNSYSIKVINTPLTKKIVSFGIANLFVGVVYYLQLYLTRYIILDRTDIYSVGLLTAGFSIMGYMGIFNRGASYINLPNVSEKMDDIKRSQLFNEYLLFNIIITIPISFIVTLFGSTFLSLLYSDKFLILNNFIYLFVLANYFSTIASAFQHHVIGLGLMKSFASVGLAGNLIIVVSTLLLTEKMNIGSVGLGYIINYIVTIPIFYIILKKKARLKIDCRVFILEAYGVLLIILSRFIYDLSSLYKYIICILLFLIFYLMVKKEMAKLLYIFINRLPFINKK